MAQELGDLDHTGLLTILENLAAIQARTEE
jgi:hypothetical protein